MNVFEGEIGWGSTTSEFFRLSLSAFLEPGKKVIECSCYRKECTFFLSSHRFEWLIIRGFRSKQWRVEFHILSNIKIVILWPCLKKRRRWYNIIDITLLIRILQIWYFFLNESSYTLRFFAYFLTLRIAINTYWSLVYLLIYIIIWMFCNIT